MNGQLSSLRKTTLCVLLCVAFSIGYATIVLAASNEQITYCYAEYPLERAGVALHLDRVVVDGVEPRKNILLVHGVTYSSHEFDVDYRDYSLVRRLAREGYGVWRLDVAGFGRSGEVKDGFVPNSDYAAEDINAAIGTIVAETGQDKIDVLGWSWGTITVGRFVAACPEHVRKAVLYAPVLYGVGEFEVAEPFHHNTWEHSVEDFQRAPDGSIDESIADPIVVAVLSSNSWRYDRETSPNGGRRDVCVSEETPLVDVAKISVPTLLICGDKDPYIKSDRIDAAIKELPEGSALEVIKGGSHVVMLEKPYYRDFQERLIQFLNRDVATP